MAEDTSETKPDNAAQSAPTSDDVAESATPVAAEAGEAAEASEATETVAAPETSEGASTPATSSEGDPPEADASATPTLKGHVAPNEAGEASATPAPDASGDAPSADGEAKADPAPDEAKAEGKPNESRRPPKPRRERKPEPEEPRPPKSPHPFIVVTALVDAGARAAAATWSHADAMERVLEATKGRDLAGIGLVELPISPAPFGALRRSLKLDDSVVGLYDVFPLASHLRASEKKVAAQFFAAEIVWTLEEQGVMGGVPLNVRLEAPKGWARDPKSVHGKLVELGALELTPEAIETFKVVKAKWDASAPKEPTVDGASPASA